MRSRHIATVRFLVMIAFAMLALPSRATIVRQISFDEKVDRAAAIVVGRCITSESRWTEDRRRILTDYRFRVEKTLKGSPSQEMTIVLPGGTVDGIRQVTLGVPEPKIDRDYVIFVRNSQVGPTILFFEQGLYEVQASNAERLIIPPLLQAVVIDSQRGMAKPHEQVNTLREFEGRVRETIGRGELNRMRMLEEKRRESASLLNQIKRNKGLVFFAFLGLVLSIWMLARR